MAFPALLFMKDQSLRLARPPTEGTGSALCRLAIGRTRDRLGQSMKLLSDEVGIGSRRIAFHRYRAHAIAVTTIDKEGSGLTTALQTTELAHRACIVRIADVHRLRLISTRDQNLEMQCDALAEACCQRVFEGKTSGNRTERPSPI